MDIAVDVDGSVSFKPSSGSMGTTSISRRVKWRRLSVITGLLACESHSVERTRGFRGGRARCSGGERGAGGCGFIETPCKQRGLYWTWSRAMRRASRLTWVTLLMGLCAGLGVASDTQPPRIAMLQVRPMGSMSRCAGRGAGPARWCSGWEKVMHEVMMDARHGHVTGRIRVGQRSVVKGSGCQSFSSRPMTVFGL